MDFLKKNGKGILLCFLVAFPSWLLVRQVGALEVIGAPVIAIIAGMVLAIAIRTSLLSVEALPLPPRKFCSMR